MAFMGKARAAAAAGEGLVRRGGRIQSQVAYLLVGMSLVTILFVAGGVWWTVHNADHLAQRDAARVAAAAYQSLVERVKVSTTDYAWWADAYQATRRDDGEWLYNNLGSGATKGTTFDLMAIHQPGRPVRYGWHSGGPPEPDPAVMPEAVVRAMAALTARLDVKPVTAVSGFAWIDGKATILSAARISPYEFDGFDPAGASVLVTGLWVTDAMLAKKGKETLLEGLAMERPKAGALPEGRGAMPIVGLDGQVAARLEWVLPRPGREILARIAPAVLVLALGLVLVSTLVGQRVRRQARDIVHEQQRAVEAAQTDQLTGLLNRTGLAAVERDEKLQAALRDGRLALIYFDLNGFKLLNDRVGHDGGDEALRATARRLRSCLREGDIAARVGGDEFVVLVTGEDAVETASAIVARLDKAMQDPIVVGGRSFSSSVSAGIAGAAGVNTFEELTTNADAAMYVAKEGGTFGGMVYTDDMSDGRAERKRIEERLRRGVRLIRRGKAPFHVVYQPMIDPVRGDLVGAEALLRWTDKELGAVSPAVFIPIAETYGLVPDLGRFVIERACADMARWPGLAVSVNVSPLQLRDPDFVRNVTGWVRGRGIDPRMLTLEITEGALIDAPQTAKRRMAELREAGFPLALDDFGTGFSSIGYLRRFKFDKLKIDRSFVTPLGADGNANMLFQSLVKLSEAFELTTIAEGVETVEQDRMVRLAGCSVEQGFLHAKPMPFDELRRWHSESRGEPQRASA